MLTTVQQVKDYILGLPEIPTIHEPNVLFLVGAISNTVEDFCRRKFGTQSYAETYMGEDGQAELVLNNWPVTAIASLTIDGTAVTEGTTDDQYRQIKNLDGDIWKLYRKNTWKSQPYGIAITYTAGYVLPGATSGTVNLPGSLERAVVELVVGYYLQRGKAGLSRESFEGLSIDMDRWPLHIKNALVAYRRGRA